MALLETIEDAYLNLDLPYKNIPPYEFKLFKPKVAETMKESCQHILSDISPKPDDIEIDFKMKAYNEDLLQMFSVLQAGYAKTKL